MRRFLHRQRHRLIPNPLNLNHFRPFRNLNLELVPNLFPYQRLRNRRDERQQSFREIGLVDTHDAHRVIIVFHIRPEAYCLFVGFGHIHLHGGINTINEQFHLCIDKIAHYVVST